MFAARAEVEKKPTAEEIDAICLKIDSLKRVLSDLKTLTDTDAKA